MKNDHSPPPRFGAGDHCRSTTDAFPDDFVWGVATSSHQIEGGCLEGERGESIWDRFSSMPGAIADGKDASVACDHYHRWREDVELMRWLGVGAYRFSIAWPRVLPEGRGRIDQAGLDFYDVLVDHLLGSGIEPFVTLYHWDLPQRLQEEGGWSSREMTDIFVDYSAAVCGRLGDRVRSWTTFNEPWCIATLGHEKGEHAPGHHDPGESLRVAHHVLLAHGKTVRMLRGAVRDCSAGIVLNLVPAVPASGSAGDAEAAREFDGALNRWYLDPLFRGRYPGDVVAGRVRKGHLPAAGPDYVMPGDLETISSPLDFLGINYYTRVTVGSEGPGTGGMQARPGAETTDMGWEVWPEGLFELLSRVNSEYYGGDIYITENGAAYPDEPDPSGRIRDGKRTDYMRRHLLQAARAVREGIPLKGYFAWSLLDNFEWAHGYTKRFGLCWVDFDTLERLPKDSAHYYRKVIEANAPGHA